MIQYLNVFFTISTRTFVRRCFSSVSWLRYDYGQYT
ncbi:hypothetical protein ECTX1999_1522, partial [Escherichia coli TX1999]